MRLRLQKRSGFTLIEIMLVIAIIALLVGTVVVNIGPMRKRSYITAAQNQISAYSVALEEYANENGFYPSTDQGLQALVSIPAGDPAPTKWHIFLKPPVIKPDPWGRPYYYARPPQYNADPDGFDLYSAGPDGRPGTDDDVVNWR